MVFSFKPFELKLMKAGKILRHDTSNAGKKYTKAKIYLRNGNDIDKKYELYDMGKVHLEELGDNVKGKGFLMFIPDSPRPKKDIKM